MDEDSALARYYSIMSTLHTVNIIVLITDVDESSFNVKSKRPNKTLVNITSALLLNSSHKKEHWFLTYQYSIWISHLTDNRLRGDVPYLIWHG